MDIKAYIASSILEQYVIGALSEKEMAEVEQMMLAIDEVKKVRNHSEAGYETLTRAHTAKALSVKRNPELREKNPAIPPFHLKVEVEQMVASFASFWSRAF